jgi:hypothetical protein
MPPAALDELQAVAQVLQHPGDCLAFTHGAAVLGRLAETGGWLRLQAAIEFPLITEDRDTGGR